MTPKTAVATALAAGVLVSASALAQQSPSGQRQQQMPQQQQQQYDPMQQQSRQQPASQYSADQIRQLQQNLNDRGFEAGPVDGQWGPQTAGAVQQFQKSQGMQPTGQLNAQTAEALGIGPGSQIGENPTGQGGEPMRGRDRGTMPGMNPQGAPSQDPMGTMGQPGGQPSR